MLIVLRKFSSTCDPFGNLSLPITWEFMDLIGKNHHNKKHTKSPENLGSCWLTIAGFDLGFLAD